MTSTIIVCHKLCPGRVGFSIWKAKVDEESRKAKGFLDRTDLPLVANDCYFSVILRFDSKENAKKWLGSAKRKELLLEAENIVEASQEMLHGNNNFWFGPPPNDNAKKWKQVVVSFVAVYPLSQAVPAIVDFGLEALAMKYVLLAGILTGIIVSFSMVYFAMPLTLKLFRKWLYPDD